MIRFIVNGKKHEWIEPVCMSRFLANIKLDPGSVIVEYNRKFLHRNDFEKTFIKDGDTLEIIKAFAGG